MTAAYSVRYDNPLKQGLKPLTLPSHFALTIVRYDNPLKQGLKHAAAHALLARCLVRYDNPLKQGLKRTGAPLSLKLYKSDMTIH